MTNLEISRILHRMAAAYQILEENRFKIIAYEKAAEGIEHLTGEVKDYWDDGKLTDVPGLGKTISSHIDELFRTGKVKHFDATFAQIPEAVFLLLEVPGLGPKKAFKLVTALNLDNVKTVLSDLKKAALEHRVRTLDGFGEKSEQDILESLKLHQAGAIKENRMVLPEADSIARQIIAYLEQIPETERSDALGSLRRMVSTVGDIDIAVATRNPGAVISRFLTFPHQKLIEKGPGGASVLLHNGHQVDLRVSDPDRYGAMIQYFTGSKQHNIALRKYALEHGLSLSEYGIKDIKSDQTAFYPDERKFYRALGLAYIPPELREGRGEIDLAIHDAIPRLIEAVEIRGDLHIHGDHVFASSHDLGLSSLAQILKKAENLGYQYIGISDHNPSISTHNPKQIMDIMKRRKEYYEQQYYSYYKNKIKRVQMLIMCEVDILSDGVLALPDQAFGYVDAVIVSVHAGFRQPKQEMTRRIVRALQSHPKVRIFGHPTGRLLMKREGIDLSWEEIYAVCQKNQIALEINAYPERLDLPDMYVPDAAAADIRFCINTDSHMVDQMDMMGYGVSVARRGRAQKRDIVNTMDYNRFTHWLMKGAQKV